ncbi:hypothetical protein Ac2012v2_003187 [Leucoagaricus gongylophorus]
MHGLDYHETLTTPDPLNVPIKLVTVATHDTDISEATLPWKLTSSPPARTHQAIVSGYRPVSQEQTRTCTK